VCVPVSFRLGELAELVGGTVVGDPDRVVSGVATLEDAGPGDLAFWTHPRYRDAVRTTRAGAILVRCGSGVHGRFLLEVGEPYLALARILELFHPPAPAQPGISPVASVAPGAVLGSDVAIGAFAVIEPGARLGDRVSIGPGSVVGQGAEVGDESVLMARVVLYPGTSVGRRCRIHAGAVLGADGFGFATSAGVHHKVPQLGRVVIEDDVEIGANTAIDRGTLGETRIGRGTKIDDLVMVAHGVRIGAACLLAAQAGIAGSTRVGAGVTFAGQAGAAGHLHIGDGAIVAAKSAVFDDVAPRAFVAGIPAIDHVRWKRTQALVRRLDELRRELRELGRRLDALEAGSTGGKD
jgi:UDP-3-O-[3-hydroxymyristoyl] glucosamine N-acyltransferase